MLAILNGFYVDNAEMISMDADDMFNDKPWHTLHMSQKYVGDFRNAAGEQEMGPLCGSLPRDAGDLAGLFLDHFKTVGL